MIRPLAILAVSAMALSACAASSRPPSEVAPPSGEGDQCRASAYQHLVGTNRSQLPAEPAGEVWRVTCKSCAVTMDYNPRRLNIVYEDESGRIEKISCG